MGTANTTLASLLTTDKSNYDTAAGETTAILTAVVTDEAGDPISGLTAGDFITVLDGTAISVTFGETATVGTYTGNLDLTGVADGSHIVEVTVTDTRGVFGNDSPSFSTGPAPTDPTTVTVDSIVYATDGGPDGKKHLNDTVTLVDDLGNPVGGAVVSITLDNTTTGASWSGSGTTGSNGSVTFSLKNAPSGCYTTTVTKVDASGLTWDGVTPVNSFCK